MQHPVETGSLQTTSSVSPPAPVRETNKTEEDDDGNASEGDDSEGDDSEGDEVDKPTKRQSYVDNASGRVYVVDPSAGTRWLADTVHLDDVTGRLYRVSEETGLASWVASSDDDIFEESSGSSNGGSRDDDDEEEETQEVGQSSKPQHVSIKRQTFGLAGLEDM